MSSYEMHRDSIDALVTAWIEYAPAGRYRESRTMNADWAVRQLVAENRAAYLGGFTYPEEVAAMTVDELGGPWREVTDVVTRKLEPAALLALVQTYQYQAIDSTSWTHSTAAKIIEAVRDDLIRTITRPFGFTEYHRPADEVTLVSLSSLARRGRN